MNAANILINKGLHAVLGVVFQGVEMAKKTPAFGKPWS
jgi:hypothetical protein